MTTEQTVPALAMPTGASRRIYVASSWRNPHQPALVHLLRHYGFEVYDFRNPADGQHGFSWSQIDPNWQNWTTCDYVDALDDGIAEHGFGLDFEAMQWADTTVLVTPCGSSAHLELGWAAGAGKRTAVMAFEVREPELMIKVADAIFTDVSELVAWLRGGPPAAAVVEPVVEQGERPVGCSCWPPNPVGVHGHACDLYDDEPDDAQPADLTLNELLAMPPRSVVLDADGWRWRVNENGTWYSLATSLDPRSAERLLNNFGPITAVTE